MNLDITVEITLLWRLSSTHVLLCNYDKISLIIPDTTNVYGTIYPTNQAVYEGSLVEIVCFSVIPPVWLKDGHIYRESYVSRYSLEFHSVKQKDQGYYVCEGTENTKGKLFQATSELLVGGKKKCFE